MTREAVNPDLFTNNDAANLPADAPDIAVVVSLWFPGMGGESLELMTRFTTVAFDAIREAGGRPHLVDSSAESFQDPATITGYDGVLFLGGGDVDATLYGHMDAVPNTYGMDRRADDYCIDLLKRSVDSDMRVLAICRGSQLLNVAYGGTLIPDIHDFEMHRGGPGKPTFLDEPINLLPGSKVADIFDRDRIVVRSGHHQAVAEVAPVLKATAVADDGVIEGTEHPEKTWVVGVQWHPEDSHGNDDDRATMFNAFVEQCKLVRAARDSA